jgi:hypothetical protein
MTKTKNRFLPVVRVPRVLIFSGERQAAHSFHLRDGIALALPVVLPASDHPRRVPRKHRR